MQEKGLRVTGVRKAETRGGQKINEAKQKKIKVQGENSFYLISLIEHKTKPEYNIFMQIFRYMVYIWKDYEKKRRRSRKESAK